LIVTKDVIVLGAGVVGMATALTLSDRGHRVTVIDGAAGPGLGTSFANGAQLSYAYTDALASPATLAQLPALLLATDPAFRFHPSLDPDFLRWGLAFLRNGTHTRFRRNTLAGLALALNSRTALDHLSQRHSLEFSHAAPGKLHLYRSSKSLAKAHEIIALKAAHGASQRVLEPDEVVALDPMLSAIRGQIVGAVLTADEEVGDPHRFCLAVSSALAWRKNASQFFGSAVERIAVDQNQPAVIIKAGKRIAADHIVLCAGMQSVALARGIGTRLPIVPMKGYSVTAPHGVAAPTMSVTDVANRVVFARLGNRMRIAGLADLGQHDLRIEPTRLAALIDSARAALPEAADYDAIESSWVGLRPMTPDSLPIIQPIARGVIANTGHGALGWTYAAGSAERVAAIIDGRAENA
jgi:D-amino-acid dehydrogenase